MDEDTSERLTLTASIVSAYVTRNSIPQAGLSELIASVYRSLHTLAAPPQAEQPPAVPAVPVKKSVTPDFIYSLEDGRKLKSLKRHLKSKYGMTPEQYRAKWNLPADYPMVAPNYAATRSSLARSMGLGRKRDEDIQPEAPPAPPAPPPAAEKKKRAAPRPRKKAEA